MTIYQPRIRVKAMIIAPNDDLTAHAVSVHAPTAEEADGYHRLIGGGVEHGESHREAIIREVDEEVGATIHELAYLTVLESIFRVNGTVGHEIVFLYTGRLSPLPSATGAFMTESDGSVLPVAWRPCRDAEEPLPLFPSSAAEWVHRLAAQLPRDRRGA